MFVYYKKILNFNKNITQTFAQTFA